MRKKLFITFLCIFLAANSFAINFSGVLHYDTYLNTPTFGFSFDASGDILDNLDLNAKLDYFNHNTYEAQCRLITKIWKLTLGGGVAYSIDNSAKSIIVPGLGFTAKMDLPFKMGISSDAIISLAPANLYEAYSFHVGGTFTFSTDNAISALKYSVKQSAEKEGKLHSFLFSVLAFEKDVPFNISLGFGADLLQEKEAQESIPFEFHALGGFSIKTKKAGTYSLSGKVTPVTYRENKTPFSVSLGIAFKS